MKFPDFLYARLHVLFVVVCSQQKIICLLKNGITSVRGLKIVVCILWVDYFQVDKFQIKGIKVLNVICILVIIRSTVHQEDVSFYNNHFRLL